MMAEGKWTGFSLFYIAITNEFTLSTFLCHWLGDSQTHSKLASIYLRFHIGKILRSPANINIASIANAQDQKTYSDWLNNTQIGLLVIILKKVNIIYHICYIASRFYWFFLFIYITYNIIQLKMSFLGFGGSSPQISSEAKLKAAEAELDMVTAMFNQ